ncbi:hypothetical protein ACCS72_38060, partial [Rhizobium ruizarguesonis]
ELEASAAQLRELNEELEHRIDQRTLEREEALAQLFEAQKLDTIGHLTGGVAPPPWREDLRRFRTTGGSRLPAA